MSFKEFMLNHPLNSFKDRIWAVIVTVLFMIGWVTCMKVFFNHINPPRPTEGFVDWSALFGPVQKPPFIYTFIVTCVIPPIWEEILYRFVPITIAKKFGEQFILPVVLASSFMFGWGHAAGHYEPHLSIVYQGVGGLMLASLFIKTGYTIWCSILAHSLYNLIIILT